MAELAAYGPARTLQRTMAMPVPPRRAKKCPRRAARAHGNRPSQAGWTVYFAGTLARPIGSSMLARNQAVAVIKATWRRSRSGSTLSRVSAAVWW